MILGMEGVAKWLSREDLPISLPRGIMCMRKPTLREHDNHTTKIYSSQNFNNQEAKASKVEVTNSCRATEVQSPTSPTDLLSKRMT